MKYMGADTDPPKPRRPQQSEANIHKVLQAMRELEQHPAVKAYLTLKDSITEPRV